MRVTSNTFPNVLTGQLEQLAQRQNLPPYVIFGDVTLRDLVQYRPRDLDEMSQISGVGAVKLERYGQAFLVVLAAHAAEHGYPAGWRPLTRAPRSPPPTQSAEGGRLSDTVLQTLALCRSGLTPEAIANQRGLKPSSIRTHLALGIEAGALRLGEVVTLSPEELRAIEAAFAALPPHSPFTLGPIVNAFDGQYDYGLLRCVRAAMESGNY